MIRVVGDNPFTNYEHPASRFSYTNSPLSVHLERKPVSSILFERLLISQFQSMRISERTSTIKRQGA